MNVFFQVESKITSTRVVKSTGALIDVLAPNQPHLQLAWYLADTAVSRESKISKLLEFHIVEPADRHILSKLNTSSVEVFQNMSDQIFKLRALPGTTVTLSVHYQPSYVSASAASDVSESTENRARIGCDKRTSTIKDEIMQKSAFKGKGFRLADVVSNKIEASGAVRIARDFIARAQGKACSVLFMNAENQEARNQVSTKLVAVKFVRGNGTGSAAQAQAEDAILRHDNAVMQYLKVHKVPNVIRPFLDGIFPIPKSNRSLLIMEHANCGEEDRDLLPNISLRELMRLMSQLASALQAVHENRATHGNISTKTIFFDTIEKSATLGHWKYGRFLENGPPECLPSLSKYLVVENSKLAIEEVRNPEDRYRKDTSDFAAVGMALISRNPDIDVLSDTFVGKDLDQTLQDFTDIFNKHVWDENQLLCTSHPLVEVIKGLLSGEKDLAETVALLSENQLAALPKFRGPTSVPGIYVAEEREMLFPVDLLSVQGTDQNGKQSMGIGAFAAVDTPAKALVAKYLSHKVRRAYAERLRSRGKGSHLISAGKGRRVIFDGARENNGIFDHHFMVEHVEVGSLLNGPYKVEVTKGKSHKKRYTLVHKFTPNCEFVYKTWQSKHLSNYPGYIVETDVVLVKSLRALKRGEELYADYGDNTAKEFFGVERILTGSTGVLPAEVKEERRPKRRRLTPRGC